MQCTFAAVVAWFLLLFVEPMKADFIKGFDGGSLESIYNAWLQQKSLPGATSIMSDMMPGLLGWKGDSLLVEVVATAEGAETLLASTFEAYGFEVTGCSRFMCSGYLPMKNYPAFSAAEHVKAVYPSLRMTNQNGFRMVAGEDIQPRRQVDGVVRADDSALTGEGLRIGGLSDSVVKGCAADIESNEHDLPNDVVVVKGHSGTAAGGTCHPLPRSGSQSFLSKGRK